MSHCWGTERKLQDILDNLAKESGKKGLTINCEKTECVIVNKRNSHRCEVRIGDIDKFKWLRNAEESEIQRCIGIVERVF